MANVDNHDDDGCKYDDGVVILFHKNHMSGRVEVLWISQENADSPDYAK